MDKSPKALKQNLARRKESKENPKIRQKEKKEASCRAPAPPEGEVPLDKNILQL